MEWFGYIIASIRHIMIQPAIVFEKWNVMTLCIAVATASSLISARFANHVNNHAVSLVTVVALNTAMIVSIIGACG